MTSPTELGLLLTFPPLNQQIGAAFDDSSTTLAILWYYCFLTQNINHLQRNLEQDNIERTDLFGHLLNNRTFEDSLRPLISTKTMMQWTLQTKTWTSWNSTQPLQRRTVYDRLPNTSRECSITTIQWISKFFTTEHGSHPGSRILQSRIIWWRQITRFPHSVH